MKRKLFKSYPIFAECFPNFDLNISPQYISCEIHKSFEFSQLESLSPTTDVISLEWKEI